MPRYKKKHDRKCGVPEWSASNIQNFNSENGEFINYQHRAECDSYGCATCTDHEKHIEITWTKVKLPLLASIDNDRAVDIGNNHGSNTEFSVGIKRGIVEFDWVSTVNNEADMFTKNLVGPEHNKHAARLCRCNEYYGTMQVKESHEQGRVSGVAECS